MATIAYGEPRFTNDIDVVVRMQPDQVSPLCAAFPEPEFYCSREAADEAVQQRFQFNILHPASGLKVDVIVASDSAFWAYTLQGANKTAEPVAPGDRPRK